MKKINLIKRLWTDSHEKQSPQRAIRYAAMLIMLLTLGVGQMWGKEMCSLTSSGDVNRAMPNYEAGYNMGTIYVWFSINGASYSSKGSTSSNIGTDRDISASNITSGLKFNKFSVPVYCHNQWHGDACSNNGARIVGSSLVMSWKVSNPSGTEVGSGNFSATTSPTMSWDGNGATATWTSNTSEKNLLTGVSASTSGNLTYTMDFWYKFQCHMYNSSGSDWGYNVNVWYPGGEDHFKYQFTIPQTTLTVNTSGDDGSATASSAISTAITYNTNYNLTASDVTGYDFVNWTTSDANITITSPTSRTGAKVKFTAFSNATITANYTPKTTTVTLNGNAPGGQTVTGGGTEVTATYDSELPSFSALTCTGGYALKGYYTASSDGTKVINADGTFAANSGIWNRTDGATLDLYAQWSLDRTLTYDANGGTGSMTDANSPYANGATVTVKSNSFTRTGYTFTGWNTAANGSGASYSAGATFSISANTTLFAQWSENMTTVTVNVNPTGAGTLTVDAAAFSAGNTTTAGVTTKRTVVATANSGKVFHDWTVTGNATGSASTNTYTLEGNGNAGTGTLTANFGIASGWYMEGNDFGGWNRGTAAYQLTYSYREMDDVVYYPTTLTKDRYWKVNNGTTPYSISNSGSPAIVKGTIYPISEEWTKSTYASSTMSNVWVVVDKGTNKKLWVQDPQTFHNVNVTGADNDKGPVKVTLKTTSAFTKGDNVFETTQFANGETFTVTVTPVTGYIPTITIGGNTPVTWWKEQATYTADGTMSTSDITVTISYTPTRAVRFAKTTGCKTLTATGPESTSVSDNTKIKDGTEITFSQENSDGYTFSKWYSNSSGTSGTQYSTSSSAYDLTISSTSYTIYPIYTANTYTVSFDVNGGTASTPDDKEVTFGSAYGTLPSGMTHTSKTFVGWYTLSSAGTQVTASTTVSTASDHTLYAQYEPIYRVDIDFKCGDAKLYPSTSVNASETALAAEISAPEILGYEFSSWSGSNATFGNASSATTTVNATAATTVTANYNVVPTVYFKNNLGWDSVFVTFDCGFNSSKENVPSNNGKAYYKMTQIGATDVFYCEIPASYISSWTGKIAFDNTNYGGTGSTTHVGTWNAFFGGECAGRGDFDANATLYIPYSGESQSRNSTKFYQTGCWMKYNSTESGYQVNMNTLVTGSNADSCVVKLTAANAGGYEFSAKIKLHRANYTYGFKLYKIYNSITGDLWYTNTGTIYASTDDLPWHFWSGSSITATSQRCGLHTEALGDYTITVSFATGRPMVNVEYPASVGDWRLAYNDRVAWSGSTHDASWYIYSRVIKAKADAEDIVSFYVSKADGANAHIELQKCTAINPSTGAETWTKQGSNLDISAITGTGIYNFKVTQNGSKVASATYLGGYEGNFYIRTDASDGGWNNYISSGKNIITYSEYAKDNSGYTHYFMRYVTKGSNIKFCIANDYSECLTEYCVSDDFTNEYIEANGNVRFMWDHRTNKVSRAYISGSTVVSDRFLVLEGDAKMFDENGNALSIAGLNANEMKFTDDQNWIYEATVKAQPGARIKLTAKYNNKIQYFYGDEGARTDETTELLIGGSGTNKYKVRVVYDFKTNRLIKAFIPDGDIGTTLAIDADLMIIREHQDEAQQITFTESGKLTDVKTVYGAMKFNKYTVNGKEKTGGHASTGASRYERDLFYISFPFDVKLSDVFGFGTYGKHWIIEYYDGKGRAKNGFWADSEPNWKFVWPAQRSSFTMKAFEGYILALELDEMKESSSIWDNGVEDVYVYFPSADSVKNIEATNRTITIDQEGYECKINRATPDGNRTVKDSYWHCIGVPSFANYSRPLSPTSESGTIDWRSTSMPYLYEWNSSNNTVSVTSSATFSFKATYSYLVQYSGDHIYWSSVNTPSSIVARERTAPKNAEFRIELQKAGEKADQTFVRLTQDENVTAGYDFNYDLSKEFNKNQANIYTMVTTLMDDGPSITEVAGNVQPMSEQTTVIPMGVKIAADGDYTFAIPDGTEGIGVTLIDNETGIRTSLSALDYTINLSAGTYENRFVLEISPIKQMPTGVEEVTGDGLQVTGVRKVMIDGILYIVKDGKVFDAHGNRVK